MLLQADHSCNKGIGTAFGTFGELLQGKRTNNQDFLVTLPITRFSHAKFLVDPTSIGLLVSPSNMYKSKKLAQSILEYFKLPVRGILSLQSNIPIGKGFASSSADLVATARAIEQCYNLCITPEQLQLFFKNIEPTDGVMYDGAVSFYHRKVQLDKCLGPLPELTIVSLDEGGQVDTIEFNQIPKSYTVEEKEEYEFLLNKISLAIQMSDLKKIGEVSTRSAILNQKLWQKRYLTDVMDICTQTDGLGIVVAHSGTCIGILFSPSLPGYHSNIYHAYHLLREINDNIEIFFTNNNATSTFL